MRGNQRADEVILVLCVVMQLLMPEICQLCVFRLDFQSMASEQVFTTM